MHDFELGHYDAVQLTSALSTSVFFENVVAFYPKPKTVANWIQGELFRIARERDAELDAAGVTPEHFAELLTLVEQGTISQATGKQLLEEVAASGQSPKALVAEKGLAQISDTSELEQAVAQAIVANPQAVADYHAGKAQAMGFLTGQVMRATRGKANPGVANDILKRQLGG